MWQLTKPLPNQRMELTAPPFKGSVMLSASDPAVTPGARGAPASAAPQLMRDSLGRKTTC